MQKTLAGAAGFMRFLDGAIEIGLLFGNGIFAASDLLGAHWIGGALGHSGELAFEPDADRV